MIEFCFECSGQDYIIFGRLTDSNVMFCRCNCFVDLKRRWNFETRPSLDALVLLIFSRLFCLIRCMSFASSLFPFFELFEFFISTFQHFRNIRKFRNRSAIWTLLEEFMCLHILYTIFYASHLDEHSDFRSGFAAWKCGRRRSVPHSSLKTGENSQGFMKSMIGIHKRWIPLDLNIKVRRNYRNSSTVFPQPFNSDQFFNDPYTQINTSGA